ncbi:hypothetical protein AAC03nite_12000 [Alicyclobacillus acidoterrestris]|uniref:hypothetical protein n=1 Tax=Alicyclobacillus suci TaxID=2816080 RepID=UPI0011909D2E|nr:hypothetical protein [Alicyclobacillus suci]GEO25415.1 hypothetical protein AAC03nite_12000 [Alicyclobacillus acidoterrestris]
MRLPRTLASLLTFTMIIGLTGCSVTSNNDTGQPGTGRGKADSLGTFTGDPRTSLKATPADTAGLVHQKPTDASLPATVSLAALQKSNTFYNMEMFDGNVGYRWGYLHGNFALERTENAGVNWYSIALPRTLPLAQLNKGTGAVENPTVQVTGENSIYVFAVTGSTLLNLHTNDAGHHWTQTSLPLPTSGLQLESVNLLGDQDGFILLRGQGKASAIHQLYRLQNNATTAVALHVSGNGKDAGLPASAQAVVHFTNPQDGWLVAVTTDGNVHLYDSHNGGNTWTASTFHTPPGLTGFKAVRVYEPSRLEQEGNFLVRYARPTNKGTQYHLVMFRSVNGGNKFTTRVEDPLFDAVSDYMGNPVSFLNQDYAFAINDQRLVASWDGGMTWRTIHSSSLETTLNAYPRVLATDFESDTLGYLLLQTANYQRTAFVKVTLNGTSSWANAQVVSH